MSATYLLPTPTQFPQTEKFESVELDYPPLTEFLHYLRDCHIDPTGMPDEQLERTVFAYLDVDYDHYQREQLERELILESL